MDRRKFIVKSTVLTILPWFTSFKVQNNNVVISTPKLNQVGFLPGATKQFAITVTPGKLPKAFELLDDNQHIVYRGKLGSQIFDLQKIAGEYAVLGDFSDYNVAGRYRVRVDNKNSHPFVIGEGVYGKLLHDSARCFYLIRANTAIDDPQTGVKNAAGHNSDAEIVVDGEKRDLTGGWYNACDYGKYTHMTAISVSHMLRLFELRQQIASLSLDIGTIYSGLPDILQLGRWGLEWLFKMQNADGSVLHKVDSQPILTFGKLPADDPAPRAAMLASSIDTGVFIGVMGHASRIFASFDATLAGRCKSAASKAWVWLSANPNVLQSDPYYYDHNPEQEKVWATCEMDILEERDNKNIVLPDIGVRRLFWSSPQALGIMSLALRGHEQAKGMIISGAQEIAKRVESDPYGFSPLPGSYLWGSNEAALNDAVICLYADYIKPDTALRTAAQSLLDYVLGRNSLYHSFVTGHGTRYTEHPFHWIYYMEKIAIPGWASGGSNGRGRNADKLLKALVAEGTPPAKCFLDVCQKEGSYASNEGETSENAALIFVAGMLG